MPAAIVCELAIQSAIERTLWSRSLLNSEIEIPDSLTGSRFDRAVADLLAQYSRARLQLWIKAGSITLNNARVQPRHIVQAGDRVQISIDEPPVEPSTIEPQAITLDIQFQDEAIFVINKPAGLVMHVAPGNYSGTLQNALLHLDPALASIPRSGIVHRLDKDTTGLVMVARTLTAHHELVQQLQARSVHRQYDAVVTGVPVSGGSVDAPIGRHPVDRKKMCVNEAGKPAVTHYRLVKKYARHCHLRVRLETGRTHQIRVHMAHIRFPLIGDSVYAGRARTPGGVSDAIRQAVTGFPRQALHARELGIIHPDTGEEMQWQVPPPSDMTRLLAILETG